MALLLGRTNNRASFQLEACPGRDLLVPAPLQDLYHLARDTPNPTTHLAFLTEAYKNVFTYFTEFATVEEYEGFSSDIVRELDCIANHMNKMARRSGVTQIVGNSSLIVGSILSFLGVWLAPTTAGLSMSLTYYGTCVGAAGAATNAATPLLEEYFKDRDRTAFAEKLRILLSNCDLMMGFAKDYQIAITSAVQFNGTELGRVFRQFINDSHLYTDLSLQDVLNRLAIVGRSGYGYYGVYKKVNQVRNLHEVRRTIQVIKQCQFKLFLDQINTAQNLQQFQSLSQQAINHSRLMAGPGYAIPQFLTDYLNVGDLELVAGGSNAALGLSGLMSGVGVIFGIKGVYDASVKVRKGSGRGEHLRIRLRRVEEINRRSVEVYREVVRRA